MVTEDRNIIYETKFTLLERNGIISVHLPDDGSIPSLKVAKKDQWSVAIAFADSLAIKSLDKVNKKLRELL